MMDFLSKKDNVWYRILTLSNYWLLYLSLHRLNIVLLSNERWKWNFFLCRIIWPLFRWVNFVLFIEVDATIFIVSALSFIYIYIHYFVDVMFSYFSNRCIQIKNVHRNEFNTLFCPFRIISHFNAFSYEIGREILDAFLPYTNEQTQKQQKRRQFF